MNSKENESNNFQESFVHLHLESTDPFNTQKFCRICYETEEKGLISPCKCSGTLKFCHSECLKLWILQRFPSIIDSSCEICKENYKLNIGYSKQWSNSLNDMKRSECMKKMLILLVTLVIFSIITVVAFVRYMDFTNKMTASIIVVVLCSSALITNILLLIRVYICSHIEMKISFWKIVGI